MQRLKQSRRRFLGVVVGSAGLFSMLACGGQDKPMLTVYTFGDSILDCARYNQHGVHPGQLLVKNNDQLFPEFRGMDLQTQRQAQLVHRARDGATVGGLPAQARDLQVSGEAVALLTIGGNDLIRGLIRDTGPGISQFAAALEQFVRGLPIRPVLIGNVYDPTFGDNARNFLSVDPALGRANHQRVNDVLAEVGERYGKLVDLHGHFLKGEPSWFTATIEPSLVGASEVRRAFWAQLAR